MQEKNNILQLARERKLSIGLIKKDFIDKGIGNESRFKNIVYIPKLRLSYSEIQFFSTLLGVENHELFSQYRTSLKMTSK
jgi:hypothetical protein